MKPYNIIPLLPRKLPGQPEDKQFTRMDAVVWANLCFYATWRRNGIDGQELIELEDFQLADKENAVVTGYCSVEYKTLMADAHIRDKNTLYKSLKKLEELGLIERKYHGPMKKTEYILHAPDVPEEYYDFNKP